MLNSEDRIKGTTDRVQGRMRRPNSDRGVLVAEGDSWLRLPGYSDIADELEDLGYDIESVAYHGDTIESMAYTDEQLDKLTGRFYRLKQKSKTPRAVLLSGGGNDLIGEAFQVLLDYSGTTDQALNATIVDVLINDRICRAYETLVDLITRLCREYFGDNFIPILVHGYANAVPDGRGYYWPLIPFRLKGPWLKDAFESKGHVDLQTNIKTIEALICRFNRMLEGFAQNHNNVRHVDVRDLLTNEAEYKNDWRDELHPTRSAFERIAARFDQVIQKAHEDQAQAPEGQSIA